MFSDHAASAFIFGIGSSRPGTARGPHSRDLPFNPSALRIRRGIRDGHVISSSGTRITETDVLRASLRHPGLAMRQGNIYTAKQEIICSLPTTSCQPATAGWYQIQLVPSSL